MKLRLKFWEKPVPKADKPKKASAFEKWKMRMTAKTL